MPQGLPREGEERTSSFPLLLYFSLSPPFTPVKESICSVVAGWTKVCGFIWRLMNGYFFAGVVDGRVVRCMVVKLR